MLYKKLFIFSFLLAIGIISCRSKREEKLFTQLPASSTGIQFSNDIDEKKFSKEALNEFGYMGGGVGIGDFNNDGLKDIFLAATS